MTYPRLFSPLPVGGLLLPNRVAMSPMSSALASMDGAVTPELIAYYQARARGGTGLIIVEFTCVDRTFGLSEERQLSLDGPANVDGHKRLVAALEAEGACAGLQLQLPGQYADLRTIALPAGPTAVFSRKDPTKQFSRALTGDEIEHLVRRFAQGARLAAQAGYRFIELHGAHSYLLMAFLSPRLNQRDDEWGGDEERRLRFPTAVIQAVKAELGPDIPLSYRFSVSELKPGGYTTEDMERMAPRLVAAGLDAVNVSAGSMDGLEQVIEPMSEPEGWRLPLTRRIKAVVDVPVIAVGVRWPETAEAALVAGDADIISLGRPLLADPAWAAKAREGRALDIRPCTSCNWCFDRVLKHLPVGCAENPLTGRELEVAVSGHPGAGRRAVVVGGGPGGMAAALQLQEAGFATVLLEGRDRLGGGLISSAAPPLKEKLDWYRQYLLRQLSAGTVDVRLGHPADAVAVSALRPDLVVLATGARPVPHEMEGSDRPTVISAYDLLMGEAVAVTEGAVVVYGGGETGCETTELLAKQGLVVTLVTRSPAEKLARDAEPLYRKLLRARLAANPAVTILDNTTLVRIGDGHVVLAATGQETARPAVQVIMAQGRQAGSPLLEGLQAAGLTVHMIGDASRIGRIGDAVNAAYLALRGEAAGIAA